MSGLARRIGPNLRLAFRGKAKHNIDDWSQISVDMHRLLAPREPSSSEHLIP